MPNDEEQKSPIDESLIAKIKQQDEIIKSYGEKLDKVIAFNNQLLGTIESPKSPVDSEARTKELRDKLLGGLK